MNLEEIIEEQVERYEAVKNKAIKKFGIDVSDTVVSAIFKEVNKDLRMIKIGEEREAYRQQREGEKMVTVHLRDGSKKTRDVKDDLKSAGFQFDSGKDNKDPHWWAVLKKKDWDELKEKEPFKSLKVREY